MAQRHTPGPWRVFTTPQGNRIIGIGEQTGEGITDCGFGLWRGGDAEALANARLIAAAPQMLEALKAALADIEAGGHLSVPMIRAAIAAADAEAR